MRIPLSAPDVQEEEIAAVAAVLRTPHLSLGPKLEEFERNIARYIGAGNAIGVSSGTAGLHLCVRALGIGAGQTLDVRDELRIAGADSFSDRLLVAGCIGLMLEHQVVAV